MSATPEQLRPMRELTLKVLSDPADAKEYLRRRWLTQAARCLREARAAAGLTQVELAARLGTGQSTIARLERGKEGSMLLSTFIDVLLACDCVPTQLGFELLAEATQHIYKEGT